MIRYALGFVSAAALAGAPSFSTAYSAARQVMPQTVLPAPAAPASPQQMAGPPLTESPAFNREAQAAYDEIMNRAHRFVEYERRRKEREDQENLDRFHASEAQPSASRAP